MNKTTEFIVTRPNRKLRMNIYQNNGKPILFLIHGLGGRSEQWREQVNHLQNKFTLIVPDLLGHGQSEKPKGDGLNPYSFNEMCLDLQSIFERYKGETNYICGHSYGGAFAMHLAYNNQQAVRKLALISPVSHKPYLQVPLMYFLPVFLLEFFRSYLDASFEKLAFGPQASLTLLNTEKINRMSNPLYMIKKLLLGMRQIPNLDLHAFNIPTLIIISPKDKIIPEAGIKNFYGQLPNHRFVYVEGVGHLPQLEKPEVVNALLDQFFND